MPASPHPSAEVQVLLVLVGLRELEAAGDDSWTSTSEDNGTLQLVRQFEAAGLPQVKAAPAPQPGLKARSMPTCSACALSSSWKGVVVPQAGAKSDNNGSFEGRY